MTDVRVIELAARQYNRFSRQQLAALGIGRRAIQHCLEEGIWVAVHEGVFAIAPALGDDRARWMAAILTQEGSLLSHASAAAAWGWWDRPRVVEIVTRPGSGGPRRLDGVLVHRSETVDIDATVLQGIPIMRVPRTLLDLAPHVGDRLLARCVREALRLGTTTTIEIMEAVLGHLVGRRGSRRLTLAVARYTGLPVHRARSASEVIALEILRDAGCPMPLLNHKFAGEEADLTWPQFHLIVEIDGGEFHLDIGEDARKQAIWEHAGFTVVRLPSDELQARLLSVAPNVPELPL
jgi:Protein of unknown function (DUF559)